MSNVADNAIRGCPDGFDAPELVINWQLSQLEFNWRVLAQAKDLDIPLLDRLKFLCISSTNLDEFYEIRVAGLLQKEHLGSLEIGPDGASPQELLRSIADRAASHVQEQYRVLNEDLLPALDAEGIRIVRRTDWTVHQRDWLREEFLRFLPILSPLGLDPAHPFPNILNKSLNFLVSLKGKNAFNRSIDLAVLQAPRILPRLIQLPLAESRDGCNEFVFLSSVIHAFVDELFPGMKVQGCHQFRVTRNSELYVDEEEVDDLRRAVEGELLSRRYGEAVRLEVGSDCPSKMVSYLRDQFQLPAAHVFKVDGPVNLNRLMMIYDLADRPDLKLPTFIPGVPKLTRRKTTIFQVIQEKYVLLHHPYQSFEPVVDFVRQAASDPDVLAIKQTLYRTGPESAFVQALIAAAKAGKEVTVVVELRARFDEEANIELARRLEDAGAHIVYGVVGHKTHAKMVLVVRREGNSLNHLTHYVHLGTGNYHVRTARLYTDYGLLTCDPQIGADVHKIFLQLTGLGKGMELSKLLYSPFTLHSKMMEKIRRERENGLEGKETGIIAKMNQLTEPAIIRELYRASAAGVPIELIVRGMCSLRPGVPGVSDHITVRSIVGRFLEHTRVICFHNNGDPEVFCTSADWMPRNFFRRVETCFPIEQEGLKKRVIQELKCHLRDNAQTWILRSDGVYDRLEADGKESFSAQEALLEERAEIVPVCSRGKAPLPTP